jgi:hypothetical protein
VIWDATMYRDELDMLRMRIDEAAGVQHVTVEAPWTHRAVPKPRHLAAWLQDRANRDWAKANSLTVLTDDWDPDPYAPWVNEHHQRSRAWPYIESHAAENDWVLICDVDEIPSRKFLSWLEGLPDLERVVSVPMRTFLFAVDWEVAVSVPPAMVAARVKWLRRRAADGVYLAEVRDRRADYREYPGQGGWHFSWVGTGGPAWQAEKLDTATCHTEILDTPEADLIRSGARWASEEDGGGLPVKPVTVDRSWPAYIATRRCPREWFRP